MSNEIFSLLRSTANSLNVKISFTFKRINGERILVKDCEVNGWNKHPLINIVPIGSQ